MGGSSGGSQPVPAAPQPLDYAAITKAGSEASRAQIDASFADQVKYYPQMEKLQLGTINKYAGMLNDSNYQSAQDAAKAGLGIAGKTAGLGDQISGMTGPGSIASNYYNQANSDLALGSQLNPEEARAASQSGVNAFNNAGLGTSAGAAASDILSRYQYGQARQQQRQGNAVNAQNNMVNTIGQAGSMYGSAANLYNAGSAQMLNIDPMQRAMGIGTQASQGLMGQIGGTVNNAYQQQMDLSGNIASYNNNAAWTAHNSAMNNNAAMSGAASAGRSQMMGSGMAAAGSIAMGVGLAF